MFERFLKKNSDKPAVGINPPPTNINQAHLPSTPTEKPTINLSGMPLQEEWILPNEVSLDILLRLPTRDARNFFISCKLFYTFKENYYENLLKSFFNEEALTEEFIAQFDRTVALLAGNSQLKFSSNEERYVFLKKNLIDASIYQLIGKIQTGCFANQSFFKVIVQLNFGTLFDVNQYVHLPTVNQNEILLSLAGMKSNAAFRVIIQKLMQLLYGQGYALRAGVDFVGFFKSDLKFKLSYEKLQIIVDEAIKANKLVNFGLSPIETAIIIFNDTDFENFLKNPAGFQHGYGFVGPRNLSVQNLIEGFNKDEILLAVRLQKQIQLRGLLKLFESKITVSNVDEIIIAAYKIGNLEILTCVFDNVPSDILGEGLQKVLPVLLQEKPSVEAFTIFLAKYQQHVTKDKWQGILSYNGSFQYIKLLQLIMKTIGEGDEKQLNDVLQIPPLVVNIFKNENDNFWSQQPRLKKDEVKQKFLGVSLLQLAVQVGNKVAVKWLLKNNIDYYDSKVLWAAIANEYLAVSDRCEIIEIILANQKLASKMAKSVNVIPMTLLSQQEQRSSVTMALAEATRVQGMEVLQKLFAQQKFFPIEQKSILSALKVAVELNDLEKVDYLLNNNLDLQVNLADILSSYTRIKNISSKNKTLSNNVKFPLDIAIIHRFLAHPVLDLKANSQKPEDALYYAIIMKRQDIVLLFLKKGVNLNSRYWPCYSTPLSLSLSLLCGSLEIAKLLLTWGADPCPNDFISSPQKKKFIMSSPFFEMIDWYGSQRYEVEQLNEVLFLMLNKMMQKEAQERAAILSENFEAAEGFHRTSIGKEIIYKLIHKKAPANVVDKVLECFSIELNAYIVNSIMKSKSTLLEVILPANIGYMVEIFAVLIKRGANLFLPVETNRQWMQTLVDHNIPLKTDWLQSATVDQLHLALQQLMETRKISPSQGFFKNIQEKAQAVDKNISVILSHENFSPENFRVSVSEYVGLLYFGFGVNLEKLFEEKNIDLAKKLLCFTEQDSKRNVLHHAVGAYNRIVLNKLFELQIYPINIADGQGKTPAHYAATSKDEETIKTVMMQPGVQLDILDGKSKTAWQLGRNNCAFVMAAISNSELKPQLDNLDPKASARLYWLTLHEKEPSKKSLDLFHQSYAQFDLNEIVKFGENYEAGLGIKPAEPSSKEIDIRLGLLKIIKAYMESSQSFMPNRSIMQFIGNCKEKKIEVTNGGLKADLFKEYVELLGELDNKFSQPKAPLPFFEKTDAKKAAASSQKTYISQQKLAEISFRGFQR